MNVSMDNVKPYFYSRYTHISYDLTPSLTVHVSTERACMQAGWGKAHPNIALLPKDATLEHYFYCELTSLHEAFSYRAMTGPEILNAICSAFGLTSSDVVWTLEEDSDILHV